jgi:uncharacterized protein (TIGR02301 family)
MRPATIAVACAIALLDGAGFSGHAETPTSKPAPAPATKPTPGQTPSAPAQAAPPAAERAPPYEPQLLRLAEMMGALAYLRDLCGAGDGEKFRAKMAALLAAEGVSEARRELLGGAYNDGFRGYATSYRECTPAANEVISRFLSEAARLAADIASRYGG